jgi:hypothetical protein
MAATPIELLKFNLQEKTYPYFTDDTDLNLLLEANGNNVLKASYKGCLLKAAADDGLEISGVKLDSNRQYWITLAESFQTEWEAQIAEEIAAANKLSDTGYITSRGRADGC